jgi:flagellar hook-associated protein 3 FlgL
MRITETRMWELATDAVGAARDRVAQTGEIMQTGVRVTRPSDDLAAWSQGERAAVRKSMSADRGDAIGSARDGLSATDAALATMTTTLTKLNELAIQAANGTLSASDRAGLAAEVDDLREGALAALNQKGLDGSYLLGGSQATVAPFSSGGLWQGDGIGRVIETSENSSATVSVSGQALTAANGVDVLGVFATLSTALKTNDVATVQSSLPQLQQAIAQVATLRTDVGTRIAALDDADGARQSFEQTLAETHARAVESDPVEAASNLTAASNALSAARASVQQLLSLLQNG